MARRSKKKRLEKRIEQTRTVAEGYRSMSLQYAMGIVPKGKANPKSIAAMKQQESDKRRNELRFNATASELRFRALLKHMRLKHTFQQVVHVTEEKYFILDFVVPCLKAIFEIDGSVHEGREEYDEWRTVRVLAMPKYRGFRVIRITNEQAFNGDAEMVLKQLRQKAA